GPDGVFVPAGASNIVAPTRSDTWDVARRKAESASFLGPPREGFLRWTRRILVVWWIALVWLELPDWLRQYRQLPTGPAHDRAALELVLHAAQELIAFPLFLIGMVGFGVFRRWSEGDPTFYLAWHSQSTETDAKNRKRPSGKRVASSAVAGRGRRKSSQRTSWRDYARSAVALESDL